MMSVNNTDKLIAQINTVVSGLDVPREDKLSLLVLLTEIGYEFKKAADVRPVVRARWNTVKYPLYECSNCCAVYQDVGYGFNFCPNCGADMRGEQDE